MLYLLGAATIAKEGKLYLPYGDERHAPVAAADIARVVVIPIVNVVAGFLVALDLSRSFGHDLAFALGLFFLGIIFYPILALGGDTYQGPAAAG